MGWAGRLFFDLEERLAGLSAKGDGIERLSEVVDFELLRPEFVVLCKQPGNWREVTAPFHTGAAARRGPGRGWAGGP
jgi:hypothetical protein